MFVEHAAVDERDLQRRSTARSTHAAASVSAPRLLRYQFAVGGATVAMTFDAKVAIAGVGPAPTIDYDPGHGRTFYTSTTHIDPFHNNRSTSTAGVHRVRPHRRTPVRPTSSSFERDVQSIFEQSRLKYSTARAAEEPSCPMYRAIDRAFAFRRFEGTVSQVLHRHDVGLAEGDHRPRPSGRWSTGSPWRVARRRPASFNAMLDGQFLHEAIDDRFTCRSSSSKATRPGPSAQPADHQPFVSVGLPLATSHSDRCMGAAHGFNPKLDGAVPADFGLTLLTHQAVEQELDLDIEQLAVGASHRSCPS